MKADAGKQASENIYRGFLKRSPTARLMNEQQGQMDASMVKLLACRQAEWITREAQQIHGGMGYAEEYAVSRYFQDARVLSIFEGAEEVLALRVVMPTLLKPYLLENL